MHTLLFIISLIFLFPLQALPDSRIKDMVNFEGIRENMLIGYGLVVGLNGTGDNLKNSIFTQKGLSDFLEKMGINTGGSTLKTRNVAAVMVTTMLPPFARAGSSINVNISAIGDAKNLKGGTLLATTLLGADGEVYAISQGTISVGAPTDSTDKNTKFNPTTGYIQNGAIIEKEIKFELNDLKEIKLALKHPDITTARSIAIAINAAIGSDKAIPTDPGTIVVTKPEKYPDVLSLLADIENISVEQESIAKIVIDEATGTVVIGNNVNIGKVAIAQGNLVVQIDPQESLALALQGQSAETESKPGKKMAVLDKAVTLSDVVQGLNALGVTPKDLIAILKTMQSAGAVQASIEVK